MSVKSFFKNFTDETQSNSTQTIKNFLIISSSTLSRLTSLNLIETHFILHSQLPAYSFNGFCRKYTRVNSILVLIICHFKLCHDFKLRRFRLSPILIETEQIPLVS